MHLTSFFLQLPKSALSLQASAIGAKFLLQLLSDLIFDYLLFRLLLCGAVTAKASEKFEAWKDVQEGRVCQRMLKLQAHKPFLNLLGVKCLQVIFRFFGE